MSRRFDTANVTRWPMAGMMLCGASCAARDPGLSHPLTLQLNPAF
ncbi:hypothetical protein [Corallococcus carmarthensis]|nr:hypothetical protein [Corallococcus carmarthensis]